MLNLIEWLQKIDIILEKWEINLEDLTPILLETNCKKQLSNYLIFCIKYSLKNLNKELIQFKQNNKIKQFLNELKKTDKIFQNVNKIQWRQKYNIIKNIEKLKIIKLCKILQPRLISQILNIPIRNIKYWLKINKIKENKNLLNFKKLKKIILDYKNHYKILPSETVIKQKLFNKNILDLPDNFYKQITDFLIKNFN